MKEKVTKDHYSMNQEEHLLPFTDNFTKYTQIIIKIDKNLNIDE